MSVLISNLQNSRKIPLKKIQKAAKEALNVLGCPKGELSVVLVDDAEIARINQTYLQKAGPTNVISFSMREGEFSNIQPNILGDVIISADTAQKEAENGGISFETRLVELLIHGILHIFGYEHEHDAAQAGRMEEKNQELMTRMREILPL